MAPLVTEIEKHVLAAERVHADDATVPVLAKSSDAVAGGQPKRRHKCTTGRLWTYVRDYQPFGGVTAPVVLFHYSRDRGAEHLERHLAADRGIMQADAYSGCNSLYSDGRKPGMIIEAACWAHSRRKFFELADL